MKKILLLCLGLALAAAVPVGAAVPGLLNFQGRLLDSAKLPRSGDHLMTFKICNSLAGTCSAPCAPGNACLWTETQTVAVANGVFAVQLGAVDAIGADVFSGEARYLDIAVAGEALTPRERLAAGPYSFKSSVADALTGNDGSALLRISSVAAGAITHETQIAAGLLTDTHFSPAAALAIGKLATAGSLGANVVVSSIAAGAVHEGALSLSDVDIANVSTARHGLAPKAPGSSAQFLRGDATWAPASTLKFLVKGADQAASGNTLQGDDDLSFPVLAGETWVFEFRLLVNNGNSSSPDWKAAVQGAAGWSCRVTQSGSEPAGAVFPQAGSTDCDASPAAMNNTAVNGDGNVAFNVYIQGWITPSSAGTVTLQWSPYNTSGTVTVLAGSYVLAQKVGGI